MALGYGNATSQEIREKARLKAKIDRMWQQAIDVQDASNLSGVVHSFAEILSAMVQTGQPTTERNLHPVCVMFASKIASLTALTDERFSDAYAACRRQSGLDR